MLKEGILKNICCICGQLPEWNGKPLSLQLDHINGISNDNRLENLRILCPHCHSQTDNFAGKNVNKTVRILNYCADCKINIVDKKSKRCSKCSGLNRRNKSTKINWPSIEELQKLLSIFSYVEVGRQLGVSDNAIRKRLKRYQ